MSPRSCPPRRWWLRLRAWLAQPDLDFGLVKDFIANQSRSITDRRWPALQDSLAELGRVSGG